MKRFTTLIAGLTLLAAACGAGDVGSAGEVTVPASLDDFSAIPSNAAPIASYTEPSHAGLSPEELDALWETEWSGPLVVADGSGAAPTGGSPEPDVDGSIQADDGSPPLPLGSVTTLPDSVQLDFLFEFCHGQPCYRDAHFMDPDNPGVGSGVYGSEMPFHVRHGFINNSDKPLGEGFDVVLYVTALDQPGEFGGQGIGETLRYTSDYVMRGTSEACGPTYRTQTEPQTCEWFVHDFPQGLPAGRHAIWAVWEAPCSAWADNGYTDSCTDPNQIISLFSSGFDAPYDTTPSYTEPNEG